MGRACAQANLYCKYSFWGHVWVEWQISCGVVCGVCVFCVTPYRWSLRRFKRRRCQWHEWNQRSLISSRSSACLSACLRFSAIAYLTQLECCSSFQYFVIFRLLNDLSRKDGGAHRSGIGLCILVEIQQIIAGLSYMQAMKMQAHMSTDTCY